MHTLSFTQILFARDIRLGAVCCRGLLVMGHPRDDHRRARSPVRRTGSALAGISIALVFLRITEELCREKSSAAARRSPTARSTKRNQRSQRSHSVREGQKKSRRIEAKARSAGDVMAAFAQLQRIRPFAMAGRALGALAVSAAVCCHRLIPLRQRRLTNLHGKLKLDLAGGCRS